MAQQSTLPESASGTRHPFTVQRLQHVSIPRPPGRNEEARHFYGTVLGLDELPIPATLAHLDLIWYHLGEQELHLFLSEDGRAHPAQHLCIQVDDVAALRAHLDAAGVETNDDTPIHNRPRFFCRDPFGNQIECTTILGPY